MKVRPQEDVAENEQEMAAAVMNAAKKTLITQVVKKNVIENIVPIVISLKHMVSYVIQTSDLVSSRLTLINRRSKQMSFAENIQEFMPNCKDFK